MTEFAPEAWSPPKAPPLTGDFEENHRLRDAELIEVPGTGPEDVAIDGTGNLFTGTDNGTILRIDPGGSITPIAKVGGRPLGIELHGDDLLVCNADLGLQLVSQTGAVEVLTDAVNGSPLKLTNNASVASDGSIYFTESSTRWPLHEYASDLIEGQTTGRLIKRDPTGETTVLVDGLQFANGVAFDSTEASVFVAETGRYRIHRHWITGDRAGQTEIFVENMPGFPDNLSFADGTLWVAIASPRQPPLDVMASRTWMRHVVHRLPEAVQPAAVRHGMVFGYDETGAVTHNLQDPTGRVAITTGVRASEGKLYVGSLSDSHIAVVDID
ncbi:MAG: SMP-30/gluconolactonase/LRE family protein [Acidimicrobiales bacterium]|nr:SMP-30/gluconolactonase/LRE family protein [Acidimicrobiales bacterium]RZV42204.1 MAG: SMP-30/gluconolactonase/LRE family protein [Acidimicrobiales bacterium]